MGNDALEESRFSSHDSLEITDARYDIAIEDARTPNKSRKCIIGIDCGSDIEARNQADKIEMEYNGAVLNQEYVHCFSDLNQELQNLQSKNSDIEIKASVNGVPASLDECLFPTILEQSRDTQPGEYAVYNNRIKSAIPARVYTQDDIMQLKGTPRDRSTLIKQGHAGVLRNPNKEPFNGVDIFKYDSARQRLNGLLSQQGQEHRAPEGNIPKKIDPAQIPLSDRALMSHKKFDARKQLVQVGKQMQPNVKSLSDCKEKVCNITPSPLLQAPSQLAERGV